MVWHSAKEYIANRLFKSIEELEVLLHKLLNEGGLVIKWGRKLKNKGNAVTALCLTIRYNSRGGKKEKNEALLPRYASKDR